MKTAGTTANPFRGWLLLGALMLATAAGGCGKKGPPVPPHRPVPLQVTTLAGRLAHDTIWLDWRAAEAVQGIKKYVILRSQVDPANPPCPGCPRVFQRVGEVTPAPETEQVQFSEPTAPGFIYTYKVQPVGLSGETGPESNAVTIDRSAP
jgi:hypothetical protein